MNGIQLKPMMRYQRTEFEGEDGSSEELQQQQRSSRGRSSSPTPSTDGTVIFPPDITRGFDNPNTNFDVVFKPTSTELVTENGDGGRHSETGSRRLMDEVIHPMVHIARPANLPRRSTHDRHHRHQHASSSSSSNVKFFKWKLRLPSFLRSMPFSSSSSSLPRTSSFQHHRSSSSSSRRRNPSLFFLIWERTSLLEKLLLSTTICLTITLVILSMLLIERTTKLQDILHHSQFPDSGGKDTGVTPDKGTKDYYCVTPACVTVASAIINAMDPSVDPCQDFYSYACGGWIRANPLPDGKSIWGSFNKLWQENQLVMKNVLDSEELAFNDSHHSAEQMARVYYHSCLDKNETIESRGAEPLIRFIEDVGGWNISGVFDESKWHFQTIIQLLHNKYNRGGGLFTWAVGADEKNSTNNIIQLDQSGLILPTRDYYLNQTAHEKVIKAYIAYMTKIGVLLGGNESEARRQFEEVLAFETRIANITIPAEERRDDERMYHKMTLKEVQSMAPFVNWTEYYTFAFEQVNEIIGEDEEVVVYTPDYLKNISAIIEEYNSTSEGRVTLANYMVWSVAQTLTPTLSKPFRDASKILRKALIGTEGQETPWRYCVSDTNNVMGFALGAMFVKSVFKGEAKELAQSMIQEVKDAFKDNLPHLQWMDEETRKLAKEKADAITDMIGFPDFILDPDKLDEKYSGLEFHEEEYFENNIKVSMFSMRKNLEKKSAPTNKTEWEMTPPAVNAYYAPTKNQIVFPAGILQAPFYDPAYPKSLNFGAMGVVMGHELTHAFDDQGREYDKEGNLHRWWRDKTLAHFVERVQCYIDQYSNYSINGDYLNGKQTLGENIADNGGLKAAFRAYEAWLETHEEELPLPGVNLTSKQLFFMGFAQVWCSVNTPEALHLQILQDPHSPSLHRVIGTLSNSVEFAKEYNCPKGSRMNSENKCDVW